MQLTNLNAQLVVIEVSGIDAQKFLQGQLTNDIRLLDNDEFQFTAHLNNKGRMLASFIATCISENTYYLITNLDIADKILPRLKMYVLRAQVTITQLNLNLMFGDAALDGAKNLQLSPDQYLNIVDSDVFEVQNTNIELWHEFLINHGIALIYSSSQELFIPQHVNFDLINGVNFKKGCYTGQEIVARTHYLGKVKRRMYKASCSTMPVIGSSIVSPLYDNQEIGRIVDVARVNNQYICLVSTQEDCILQAFLDLDNQHQLTIYNINY